MGCTSIPDNEKSSSNRLKGASMILTHRKENTKSRKEIERALDEIEIHASQQISS